MKKKVSGLLTAMALLSGLLSPLGGGGGHIAGAASGQPVEVADSAVQTSSVAAAEGRSSSYNGLKAFSDVPADSWAARAVQRWIENGIVGGYGDGTFRPGAPVSKAEFAVIINRIFNYSAEAAALPGDVPAAAWFSSDIAKGIAAGYLIAGKDGRIEASAPLTRAEAAVALQKIFRLDLGGQAAYSDLAGTDNEVKDAAAALSDAGFLKGYPDGSFKPQGRITRAELAQMVDRMVPGLVRSKGEITLGKVQGNVVLSHADITLKDTVVEGNLYLSEGIGEGKIILEGVKVTGTTFILGGGEQGTGLQNSVIGRVQAAKRDGNIRMYASGTTSVGTVLLNSGATLEENGLTGEGFTDVEVSTAVKAAVLKGNITAVSTASSATGSVKLTLAGKFGKLTLGSPSQVVLADHAQVAELLLAAAAKGTAIQGSGSFGTAQNNAEGVTVSGVPLKPGRSGP
ncbi:S-layer homology domain-containing protein, partial [Paenibacillus graminis]|uniref:S-layer homology domain-containing protein n=1 Tax=Paenibacillus graminis TaxID=189425 RepID=UPI002DBC517D